MCTRYAAMFFSEVEVAVVADSCPPTILSYSPLLRASVTSEHCCMRVRHMMLWQSPNK